MAEERVEPAGDDKAERSGKGLLKPSAGDDGSATVSVGDRGEGITE
jgi:hypothetical protein